MDNTNTDTGKKDKFFPDIFWTYWQHFPYVIGKSNPKKWWIFLEIFLTYRENFHLQG